MSYVVGSTMREHWCDTRGPLSLKWLRAGRATWALSDRGARISVSRDRYVVVNEGERYQMTLDSTVATTCCVFLNGRSFSDAWRSHVDSPTSLLDDLEPNTTAPVFLGVARRPSNVLVATLDAIAEGRRRSTAITTTLPDDAAMSIATVLAGELAEERGIARRIDALHAATRDELTRRLLVARDFLHDSVGTSIQLADVAQAACLAPYHLHRTFSRAFGATPHRYLTTLRLQLAHVLVRDTPMSIAEVARRVGFASATSFTNRFRRAFSASPRMVRRRKSKIG